MHGTDIFISYAREDEVTARRFADAFASEGFTVWWDAALHSGETFDEVIEQELRNAKAVVVLWSPHSVASRWVRAEATLADRNRTFAPVIIAPCNRPIIFELTHTADLTGWSGDTTAGAWTSFVKDVRRMVSAGRAAEQIAAKSAPETLPPSVDAITAQQQTGGNSVDSLLSAVAALQEAILKQGQGGGPVTASATVNPIAEPAPIPATPAPPVAIDDDEDDEEDATQFYTQGDHFAMLGETLHCLEVSVGDEIQQRFVVTPLGLKIGRTAPADVVLADSKVSRAHCLIELKDDQLFVSDLKSTNGTFVDGQRVTGAAIIPVGSALTVGHFRLVHEIRNRAEI